MDFDGDAVMGEANLPSINLKPVEMLSSIFAYLNLNGSIGDQGTLHSLELFQSKCHNETVSIDDSGFVRSKYITSGEEVTTNSAIETTTFLRVFGHLLSKLQIDYSSRSFLDDSDDFDEIERAVAHHCADSLIEIELLCFDSLTFNGIDKSFPNVTTVSIVDGCVDQSLSKLCQWFPNVEHLLLLNNVFSDRKHIEVTFPNLKQLTLQQQPDRLGKLTSMSIVEFLRANVHLQSLCLVALSIPIDSQMLNCINETLPELVDLTFELFGNADFTDDNKVDFKALKKLTIHLPENRQCQVPLVAENLEELVLVGYRPWNMQWTNFIANCKHLVQLLLLPDSSVVVKPTPTQIETEEEDVLMEEQPMPMGKLLPIENLDETLMVFAMNLPNLTMLHVCGDYISTPIQLGRFVAACETLQTLDLGFRYSNQSRRQTFATALGVDWKVVIHKPHIDYHRITLTHE